MSQSASDVPRFVQIVSRYKALVGFMAVLGLLGGALFAALNPPVFTSSALVALTAPVPSSCPVGAICGGPAFPSVSVGSGYVGAKLLQTLPGDVQVKAGAGNALWVTTTARTAAQAEAAADEAALRYVNYADSLGDPGYPAAAQLLQPATSATGTAPWMRLRDDALLGALIGALLGVIAALGAGRTTIDTLPAPPVAGFGEADGGARRQAGFASTGVPLEQMAQEYLSRRAIPDKSQAGPA